MNARVSACISNLLQGSLCKQRDKHDRRVLRVNLGNVVLSTCNQSTYAASGRMHQASHLTEHRTTNITMQLQFYLGDQTSIRNSDDNINLLFTNLFRYIYIYTSTSQPATQTSKHDPYFICTTLPTTPESVLPKLQKSPHLHLSLEAPRLLRRTRAPDGRTRSSVSARGVEVKVEHNPRIGIRIPTLDSIVLRRRSGTATSNLDLYARGVELCTAGTVGAVGYLGLVQPNDLSTDQVVALSQLGMVTLWRPLLAISLSTAQVPPLRPSEAILVQTAPAPLLEAGAM
jgi:hypothetical protein